MFSVKTGRWWNTGTVIFLVIVGSAAAGWAVDAHKIGGTTLGVIIGFLVLAALVRIENLCGDKRQLEAKVKSLEAGLLSKLDK